jgi:type IV pilus assembly protein PilF
MMRLSLVIAAVAASAAALAADPTDSRQPSMVRAANYNTSLAVAYLKQNDVVAAREKIEKALQENPRDPVVQSSAGLVYERLNETDKADRFFSKAVSLAPDDPDMQNNYAVFLCRHGKYDKGLKLFEKAAKNPSYTTPESAYSNAGVCARQAGQVQRAEDLFRKALGIRADYPDALLQMADLSLARDAAMAARAFLERYLGSTPATPDVLLLGVRIERKLGDRDAETRYAKRLEHDFPDSTQARDLHDPKGNE